MKEYIKAECIEEKNLSVREEQVVWDDIIAENIYVICNTPMAVGITKRTLCGFREDSARKAHIKNDQLIEKAKNNQQALVDEIKSEGFWKNNNSKNMIKFSAVVGNPPYQEVVAKKETANGQKVSINIFQHFQIISDKVGKYTSLIYPGGRWIHRSGKGVKKFGYDQINDPHLSLLIFIQDANEIFSDVEIADGLTMVLKDKSKTKGGFRYIYLDGGSTISLQAQNPGKELFVLNPPDSEISDCLVKAIAKYGCLHESILSQKLFSIESDFVEKNPTLVREYEEGDLYDPDTEIKLLTNDKAGSSGRTHWYIAKKDIIKTGKKYVDKWKVIVSSAHPGGAHNRSSQIAIVDNHSAFGRSRVALKTFDTKKEAENFFKYATSEIIRFAFLLTDESFTSLAYKVPDLKDYSDSNGIVDYSGDVNEQLYRLFDIDENNQYYIKKVLVAKPVD